MMNERIKELIFEAVSFRLDPDSNAYEAQVCPEELEYLAELIVRECAKVANDSNQSKNRAVGVSVGDVVREHFGVEE